LFWRLSYFAFCYESNNHNVSFRQFAASVSDSLAPVVAKQEKQKREEVLESVQTALVDHRLEPISNHELYANKVTDKRNKGPDLQCRICGNKHARFYCVGCSSPHYIHAMHGPTCSHSNCFRDHLMNAIAPLIVDPDDDGNDDEGEG